MKKINFDVRPANAIIMLFQKLLQAGITSVTANNEFWIEE